MALAAGRGSQSVSRHIMPRSNNKRWRNVKPAVPIIPVVPMAPVVPLSSAARWLTTQPDPQLRVSSLLERNAYARSWSFPILSQFMAIAHDTRIVEFDVELKASPSLMSFVQDTAHVRKSGYAKTVRRLALQDVFFRHVELEKEAHKLIRDSDPIIEIAWGWHGSMFIRMLHDNMTFNSSSSSSPPKLLIIGKETSGPCHCPTRDPEVPCPPSCRTRHESHQAAVAIGLIALENPKAFLQDLFDLCSKGKTASGLKATWVSAPRTTFGDVVDWTAFDITRFADDANFEFILKHKLISGKYYRCTTPRLLCQIDRLCCLASIDRAEMVCTRNYRCVEKEFGNFGFNNALLGFSYTRQLLLQASINPVLSKHESIVRCVCALRRFLRSFELRELISDIHSQYNDDVIECISALCKFPAIIGGS